MKSPTTGRGRGTIFPAAILLSAALSACTSGSGSSTPSPSGGLVLQRAFPALTFTAPIGMYQPPGDSNRWFLLERAGRVILFSDDDAAAVTTVSLDIRSRVSTSGEGGLLGMAFHPSFAGSGDVYLSYTGPGSGGAALLSVLSRFRMDKDGIVAPNSESIILTVRQPFTNHNGGCIAFGPEGYLYFGLGDGGLSGDPGNNGQDTTTLLGAILRLDVASTQEGLGYIVPADNVFANSGTDAPEIFAWGFRNPWRFSFDRQAPHRLWAADVGQNLWEEVDLVESGKNYGWNIMEGTHCYPPGTQCDPSGLTAPAAEYGHDEGDSVSGGYVYRGTAVQGLKGHYIYGDYETGRIWGFDTASLPAKVVLMADTDLAIVSFAEDAEGELYVLDIWGGTVWRVRGAEK